MPEPGGGLAWRHGDRATLVSMAACSLVDERTFYGDSTGKIRLLLSRVSRAHPEWTLRLAVYLREALHLRSASRLVLAHAALVPGAGPLVARALPRVAARTDDLVAAEARAGDRTMVEEVERVEL